MSATSISTGPETVPPGRRSATPTSSDTVARLAPTSSTTQRACGKSFARNAVNSSCVAITSPCVLCCAHERRRRPSRPARRRQGRAWRPAGSARRAHGRSRRDHGRAGALPRVRRAEAATRHQDPRPRARRREDARRRPEGWLPRTQPRRVSGLHLPGLRPGRVVRPRPVGARGEWRDRSRARRHCARSDGALSVGRGSVCGTRVLARPVDALLIRVAVVAAPPAVLARIERDAAVTAPTIVLELAVELRIALGLLVVVVAAATRRGRATAVIAAALRERLAGGGPATVAALLVERERLAAVRGHALAVVIRVADCAAALHVAGIAAPLEQPERLRVVLDHARAIPVEEREVQTRCRVRVVAARLEDLGGLREVLGD